MYQKKNYVLHSIGLYNSSLSAIRIHKFPAHTPDPCSIPHETRLSCRICIHVYMRDNNKRKAGADRDD